MKNWYYKIEDKEFDSVTKEELVNLIELGELRTNTLVRKEDMNLWVKASSINGLLPVVNEKEKNVSNTSMVKYIFFLLLSTFWIIYEGMPYVPLGFILVVFWVRVKSLKYYIPFLLLVIIGFLGTGSYLTLFTEQRTMMKTGNTYEVHKFNFGLRFGTTTLENLRNRGKIIIYKDKRVAYQVAKVTNVMEQFVESYNKNSIDFLMKSFANLVNIDEQKIKNFMIEMRTTHGDIKIFSHMGEVTYQEKQPVFAVFYKINTQKDKSRVIRLLFTISADKTSISFIKVGFIPKDIEFRVIEI